ncbi:MAG: MMPL family transporter [Endomicrobium sp.]|jgi:predicted exporter|nr:MMPL family transporter [Endomicrobium sp.]
MIWSLIAKHKKLYFTVIAAVFLCFSAAFFKIRFGQDIAQMLPASFAKEINLFQSSPLSNKLFVVVEGKDKETAESAAQSMMSAFCENEELNFKPVIADAAFLLSYYYNIAPVWNENFEKQILPLLNKESVILKTEEAVRILYSAEGMFRQNFVLADPLGFLGVFAGELKKINAASDLKAENGFLSSRDGKRVLLIFNYDKNFLNAGSAKEADIFFNKAQSFLPEGARAFYMGAPRYTAENSRIILSDIKKIFFIAGSLMLLLFFVFFREKKSLFIYALPSLIVVFSTVVTAYVFGSISGIAVGFGSVLMGLCIDYCVYMYFALKASKEECRFAAAKAMIKPISISALTSIAVFSLLFFSNIAVFKQISVFCACGLTAAFFISIFICPLIFDCAQVKEKSFSFKSKLKPKYAAAALAAIVICSFAGIKFATFNSSFESLNTVSKQFQKDKAVFESLTSNAYNDNEFLFVFADTREEVLENNERLSDLNKDVLFLADLFPSKKRKEINVARWKKFWNEERINDIKETMGSVLKQYAVDPNIFKDFYSFLETGKFNGAPDFSLEDFYNPVIKRDNGFAFVNIIPKNSAVSGADGVETAIVSNSSLQLKIKKEVFLLFYKIMACVVVCAFLLIGLFLKNFKFAALSMLPPLCGIGVFFAIAALLKIEINIFGLFTMPLIIGLGIDYGIFIIFQNVKGSKLHPDKAVICAALSTLIGFGSLMAAQHKVLFIIGLMVFSAILTAILVSLFIMPAFLKTKNAQ